MKKLAPFILFLFASPILAEQVKTIGNPWTGRPDYITTLSSGTLPAGSTQYIQNTLSPTITTQQFSVQNATVTNNIDIGTPGTVTGLLRIGRGAANNRNLMLTGTGTAGLAGFDKTGLNRTPLVGSALTIDSEDSTSSSYATYERNATAGGTTIIFATRSDQRVGIATNVINAQLQVDSSAIGNKVVIVQGITAQTADLLEAQDNTGAILFFVDKSGSVGISTNSVGNNVFNVGSSTTMAFTNNGHFEFHATTTPVLSSCGTGFSIVSGSSDNTGTLTMGSLTISCTLTFSSAWKNIPQCFANDETGVNAVKVVPSINSIIFTTAGSGGDTVDYFCSGDQ